LESCDVMWFCNWYIFSFFARSLTNYLLFQVDSLIAHDHIFKQSIILVKAWCYHESRLLGSNSGLFSTYALKVLVLYIFNLYGNGFAGPLEVTNLIVLVYILTWLMTNTKIKFMLFWSYCWRILGTFSIFGVL
jgi:hypothetical protein